MSNVIVGKKLLGKRLLGVWFFLARSTAIHKKSGGGKLRKAHETASCKSALKTPIGIPAFLHRFTLSPILHINILECATFSRLDKRKTCIENELLGLYICF